MNFKNDLKYLRKTIGDKLTAYLSGVNGTKIIRRWANEDCKPRYSDVLNKLATARNVTEIVLGQYDVETLQSWLLGTNTSLMGASPANVIRDYRYPEFDLVIPAAKAFVRGA